MQIIVFANFASALAITSSDMVSTWWFMSPLQKLGVDPSKYEAGKTARWFVRNLGIRIGLISNGIIELAIITGVLCATALVLPYIFRIDVILSALFVNSVALTYFSLIIRNNYEFGKRSRELALRN